jgi:hypothetical protein
MKIEKLIMGAAFQLTIAEVPVMAVVSPVARLTSHAI